MIHLKNLLGVFCISLFTSGGAMAFEIGISVNGGFAIWDGTWSDTVSAFSIDFGQKPNPSVSPAASAYIDILFRPVGPLALGIAVGSGTWGGRIVSDGGTAAVRVSSIAMVGIEFAPSAGLRFPAGRGGAGVDLRIGLGSVESPLWTMEAWKDAQIVQSTAIDIERTPYVFAGVSAGYGFPLGPFVLACNGFFDIGTGLISDSRDLDALFRFGVGLRFSRTFTFPQKSA